MAEGKIFQKTGRLFDVSGAFDHSDENAALFDDSIHEAVSWHWKHCPAFRSFLECRGFSLSGLMEQPPEALPPFFVTVFKHHRLVSIDEKEVKIELTSSGTGGQKSSIVLDNRSYRRILRIVDNIFGSLGLVNREEEVNYICFTYDPRVAKNVGTAFSDKILTGLTRRRSVFYSIKWDKLKGSFEFDLKHTTRRLLDFSSRPEPVRILGFPAYLWEVCDLLEQNGTILNLGERSFVITGGGWKLNKDKEVTKEVFKGRVSKILGVPAENIRDTYGMVEHGIPYVDCECGNLHVPIYARVRAIDPETLRDVPSGTPGLLHLMTPYLSSYPSISLISTDRVVVAGNCPCGRPGDTFRVLGRAGVSKHKGCAITALELLK